MSDRSFLGSVVYRSSAIMYLVFATGFALLFIATICANAFLWVQFDRGCGGRLKRAADANVVSLAKQELGTAIAYAERNGLTSGYTSVFWTTPDEDLGFWYANLKAAYGELEGLSADATLLERSNVLLKLRETLLDHGQRGEHVTAPDGISRYPHNRVFAAVNPLSIVFLVVAVLYFKAWRESLYQY